MRALFKTLGLGVLAMVTTVAFGLGAQRAFAHRAPASVLSLVAWGDSGADVLRLSEGLVIRDGDAWRYVCPALWGADDITPAEALEGGPVVIGSYTGMFLLDGSGAVSRHPDPAAEGQVIGFAKVDATLFSLLIANDLTAVVKVTADRVETVWSDPLAWSWLSADPSNLHVLRVEGTQLEHVQLSWQGAVIAREQVDTPEQFVGVSAQVLQEQLHIMGLTFNVLMLGQIQQGAWVTECTGGTNLSGPIEAGGQQFVTVDGVLTKFTTQCAPAVETPEPVSCVGQAAGRAYSCTKSGVSMLGPDGVGETLFRLSDLGPPDLGKAASCEVRDMCTAQWLRYQTDLAAAGLSSAAVGIADSAVETGGSGATCPDPFGVGGGGMGSNAGAGGASDAGAMGATPRESGGCRVAPGGGPESGWFWLALAALWIRHAGFRLRNS